MTEAQISFTDGKAYERMMGRWSRVVGKQFLRWLDVGKGLQWLDVGCGNGAFTEEIVAQCAPASVMGIDPSEAQIAYARTRSATAMAQFRVGDAQVLPYADASVDVAAMALVIAFVPDPAKAVAEMARVVRPGGWAAAYMWDLPAGGLPLRPVFAALKSMGMTAPFPPSHEISRQEALQGLWDSAGFVDVATRVIRITVEFESLDDFWDSNVVPIGPQGKIIAEMSSSAKDVLRDRLRDQLPIGPDGRIAYEAFSNAVMGRVPG